MDTDQHVCGICGRLFDSATGRGMHMSSQHGDDEIKSELITELQNLADELGETPAQADVKQNGKYGLSVYERRFGRWNAAIEQAGLEANAPGNEERAKSRSDLLDELARLADELGRAPTAQEMTDKGGYGDSTYLREFGAWGDALEEAGIEVVREYDIAKTDLLDELVRLTDKLGQVPKVPEMRETGRYGVKVYQRKFGSWNNAVEEAGLDVRREMAIAKSELLSELINVSDKLGQTPSRQEMIQHGKYGVGPYYNQFDNWNDALREAGLDVNKVEEVTKSELLDELTHLAEELGRTPSMGDMNRLGEYSSGAYQDEFGKWSDGVDEAGLDFNRVYFPDHLDHRVRSSFEEEIADILLDESVEYGYESLVIEYDDGRTYTPDFVTNQYVIEVKGYARLADDEEYEYPDEIDKAEVAMEQLTDRQYVVIQGSGPKIPASEYIEWDDRDDLRNLL